MATTLSEFRLIPLEVGPLFFQLRDAVEVVVVATQHLVTLPPCQIHLVPERVYLFLMLLLFQLGPCLPSLSSLPTSWSVCSSGIDGAGGGTCSGGRGGGGACTHGSNNKPSRQPIHQTKSASRLLNR